MSANFSPVIQAVQISFLWRQEKMLQSCLRPTIPSVKLPPSKLFRILYIKKIVYTRGSISAASLCMVFDPYGGMSSDSFSRMPSANQVYLH